MTHEINIYGDIVPFKWLNDGSEYDLKDLNASLSAITPEENDELIVNIHTFGGCTSTAFGIYNKLQRFRDQNKITLTTRVDGWCASSGVIILLAGDRRIGNQFAEPFVHNAWTFTMGDKNDHQKQMEDLARVDDQIASLYSQRTSIEKDKAIELMNSETFVTPEDSLAFGFYTELENVYAAENMIIFNSLRNRNNQQRLNFNNNMADKAKETKKKDLFTMIENFFLGTKNKIVFTADNSELDFYELGEDETPAIGDKARFDGKPAGDSNGGEYVIPNVGTYKFTGEELTEIEVSEDDDNEVENLKTEIENLKTQISNLTAEKTAINQKLDNATKIIKGFKELENDDEDEEDQRDGKPAGDNKVSRIGNAISKLKNKNTNGSNK